MGRALVKFKSSLFTNNFLQYIIPSRRFRSSRSSSVCNKFWDDTFDSSLELRSPSVDLGLLICRFRVDDLGFLGITERCLKRPFGVSVSVVCRFLFSSAFSS